MTGQIEYTVDSSRVATIALNYPEALNALSSEMLEELSSVIDAFVADDDRSVAILKGNGRGFCSGFNMSKKKGTYKAVETSPWEDRQRLRRFADIYLKLWDCPKPIIAQVHGFCMAGGVQLPMCCDLVVVSEDCRIGWPKLPTGGGWIGPMFAFLGGPQRAKQMSFIAGSEMTGVQAAEWGYANFAVPAAELDDAVRELARNVAKTPPSVLQLKKAAINRAWEGTGFRDAFLAGVEWDTLVHKDPATAELRRWLREDGMKGAIARFHSDDQP